MASWTTPKTWNVGDILTAADMNTYVRDNTAWMAQPVVAGQPVATGTTTPGTNGAKYAKAWLPARTYTIFGIDISASAGNIDVGVFDDNAGSPGTKLWSKGSGASPGTGQQDFTVSPSLVITTPGYYWLGISGSNNSLQIGSAPNTPKSLGKSASAGHPLASNPTVSDNNDWPCAILR